MTTSNFGKSYCGNKAFDVRNLPPAPSFGKSRLSSRKHVLVKDEASFLKLNWLKAEPRFSSFLSKRFLSQPRRGERLNPGSRLRRFGWRLRMARRFREEVRKRCEA
jgi:hypothetical protein